MGIEPSYDLEKMVDKPVFIEKIVFDGAKSQFYDEAMTGEFFQFEKNSVHLSPSVLSLATGSARGQVNLEVDPVLHGWTKALRLISY